MCFGSKYPKKIILFYFENGSNGHYACKRLGHSCVQSLPIVARCCRYTNQGGSTCRVWISVSCNELGAYLHEVKLSDEALLWLYIGLIDRAIHSFILERLLVSFSFVVHQPPWLPLQKFHSWTSYCFGPCHGLALFESLLCSPVICANLWRAVVSWRYCFCSWFFSLCFSYIWIILPIIIFTLFCNIFIFYSLPP